VAAIESRVKRARALGRQRMTESSRHPATGLMARPHLLQRLGAALPSTRGGVFFVEIEGNATLEQFLEGFPSVSREQAIQFIELAKESLLACVSS